MLRASIASFEQGEVLENVTAARYAYAQRTLDMIDADLAQARASVNGIRMGQRIAIPVARQPST